MYVIRDIFDARPGKAKDLVKKMKGMAALMEPVMNGKIRVLTDTVATYWTVVVEITIADLDSYFNLPSDAPGHAEAGEIMSGYMDLVTGGRREIFKVEE